MHFGRYQAFDRLADRLACILGTQRRLKIAFLPGANLEDF